MANLRISHYQASDGDNWYSVESEYQPGHFSSFALPLAIAGIALYALHYMVASGIIGSLTMLGR